MLAMHSCRPLWGFPSTNRADSPALTNGAIACRPFGTQAETERCDLRTTVRFKFDHDVSFGFNFLNVVKTEYQSLILKSCGKIVK